MTKCGSIMKKNYIILAHKEPKQIERLIASLEDGLSNFFIHIDLNSNFETFVYLEKLPHVVLIKNRIACSWGDFSIVKATVNLLQHVMATATDGYTILLSGQDYPIKSSKYIDSYLTASFPCNFIDVIPIHEKWSLKMVKDKTQHYHVLHSKKRSDSNSYAPFFRSSLKQKLRSIAHLLKGRLSVTNFKRLLDLPARISPFTHQFAGSQWWALTYETTQIMLSYIEDNYNDLENYYQYTSAPDEIFFQSVFKYIVPAELQKIKPSLTYTNWVRRGCDLPVTFSEADEIHELSARGELFARKFDINTSSKLLDQIDTHRTAN